MSHLLSIPSRLDPRRSRRSPATHTPPVTTPVTAPEPVHDPLDALATDLDGVLVRPGDPDWDTARLAWHLDVDQRPAAVVVAASVRDVVTVVDAARTHALQVAPQSTGHNAAPLGDLSGSILLKLHELRQVQIDPAARIARVEGGALWADVTTPAAEHGLAALAGSAADVGVAGYTLGGGVSWLARSHGLSASSVVAIEVVTADGRLRRVDEHHDPELFWALRGGGGSFGVVTALELRLYDITEVYAGVLFFPLERAEEVLQTWRRWTQTVPDAVTSVGRILRFPPLPDLPPFLSGQSYVVVEATCQLDAAEADELLAPLRELGPAIDTFATIPMTELSALHMDPPGPTPGKGDGALITSLPEEAITSFVRVAGPGVDSPLLSVELRHLGGALRPGATPGGAVTGFDADFLLFAVGITPTPESVEPVEAAVTAVQYAMGPWTRGCYLNFAERTKGGETLWGTETFDRLREVKAAYDAAEVIRSNHPVKPALSAGR